MLEIEHDSETQARGLPRHHDLVPERDVDGRAIGWELGNGS
ncbi:MAG: hypothetical protein ACREVK_06815 [Gammaproteobacteria bacterium]